MYCRNLEHKKDIAYIHRLEQGYSELEKTLGGNDMKVDDIVGAVKVLKAEQGRNAMVDFIDNNNEYIPPKAYRPKN